MKDNDALTSARPQVTISGPNYVAEGDTIRYTLAASESPDNDIDINVMFKVTGDFMATSETEMIKTEDIASSGTMTTITFATKADDPESWKWS